MQVQSHNLQQVMPPHDQTLGVDRKLHIWGLKQVRFVVPDPDADSACFGQAEVLVKDPLPP